MKIQKQSTRKFTEVLNISDWDVLTDTGYNSIQKSNITIAYDVWRLITKSHILECADDHIVFDKEFNEVFVKDLQINQLIQTETGLEPVISVKNLGISEPMYDLTLAEGTNHRYFTNGILSHNTTVLLELLSKLHATGKKVLFISAEMNQIDMSRYLKRFPHWGQIPILFLGDWVEESPKEVIESVTNQGWDLILTDSYTEVNDTVKEACNMTRGKTEKWFLDLMDLNNKANNKLQKHTTFLTILQLSKGGVFVGSNKLKHMATAMLHLDWEGNENSGRRYMEFSKNRGGDVGKKLFFDLSNGVTFDEQRYARDLFNDQILQDERKQLETEGDQWDRIFETLKQTEEE